MSSGTHENGKCSDDVQQLLFAEIAAARANGGANSVAVEMKPHAQKRPPAKTSPAADALAITDMLRDEFGRIVERIAAVESLLLEIHSKVVTGSMVKEYYTTHEVARLVGRKPYTVREWCRLGRLNAEKAHAGRGLDEEWRISHTELLRYQNEGLLSMTKLRGLPPPPRL